MMNQIKIGTFISERRKAKGWTQGQLAEKLEITDKAVSKWETGRSMPDLSLFMPLCALLDVTLNELFAGERIAEEKLKEKTDEVLMDVITNWLGHDKWESKEGDTTLQTVLEVENVSKRYENVSAGCETEKNSVLAVNDVSFRYPAAALLELWGLPVLEKQLCLI